MADIIHGAKVELYPNDAQRRQFDLWRVRGRELWNLLLGIEEAAYSGEKFKTQLRWRSIWADVTKLNYDLAYQAWKNGKTVRMGKAKGKVIKPMEGPEPIEPSVKSYWQIMGHRIDGKEPGIFLWENDLLKVMARLKAVEQTKWINDLHSHGCQAVCRDVVKAINAFIREKKKAAKGQSNGDWGFPRFKKARYASGSVAFVNTQIIINREDSIISFPNGVGEVKCGPIGKIPEEASLREARIWREGERWFMSAQFKFACPKPKQPTGRECGIKVAGKAIYTVHDGNIFYQNMSREYSAREDALDAIASVRASRKKMKSKAWYRAQERLVKNHAYRRNVRSDIIHKGSRIIADSFDRVAIDTMDIKGMMKKKNRRDKTRRELSLQGRKPPAVEKKLRKLLANAAMYDARMKVEYKVQESGGVFHREHVYFPNTQICLACGRVNEYMKDGRMTMHCECGHRLQRQKNSSGNIRNQDVKRKEATILLAAE